MTKEELERYLAEGLSLEQIGKRVGRNPSTISYHLKKHGLKAVNQGRHANRGGISQRLLEAMAEEGLSLAAMAEQLDRSIGTVRYWLHRYGLEATSGSRRWREGREARKAGLKKAVLECRHHGRTQFILENGGGWRCMRCRRDAVVRWRRNAKRRLVEEAGGRCVICGYDRFPGALEFHHLDPSAKEFGLSTRGLTRSIEKLRAEAQKCVLLCATCHAEVEGGYSLLPVRGPQSRI